MKRRIEDLALFGGEPVFAKARPIGQLYAPDRKAFLARLERIVSKRRYSNGGPMQEELEARLSEFHEVGHVVAFSNACVAIVALLHHVARPEGRPVVIPALAYRGLPHLIGWAGGEVRFCDVERDSHTITRRTVDERDGAGAAAILAPNNMQAPADLDGLAAFGAETGVPVIYDSVDAIGARYRGKPFGGNGVAEVFSLHATKLLNGFEGGYVATDDFGLAEDLRAIRSFGFDQIQPEVRFLGLNGKLNEVHAAMALGSLEQVGTIIARNRSIFEGYCEKLDQVPGLRVLRPAPGMEPNHKMALIEIDESFALGRDGLLGVLHAERAMARPYFSPPMHRSPISPPGLERPSLPVTDFLSKRIMQAPTGALLSDDDLDRIAEVIGFVAERGAEIGRRIAAAQPEAASHV